MQGLRALAASTVVFLCVVVGQGGAFAAGIPVDAARGGKLSLAPILEARGAGVVTITAVGVRAASPRAAGVQSRRGQGDGSGVIVDAARGYVLTNNHVVNEAQRITVNLSDGRSVDAKLIGGDAASDIALLQIKADRLTAVPLGETATLKVGDFVIAVGNPFGLGQTVSSGIVSALGRGGLKVEGYEDFIQTDAAINPGNSGGALLDLDGNLIGINAAIYGAPTGMVAVGIGFAIPVEMARAVMEQLIQFGNIKRGRLGAVTADLTAEQVHKSGSTGAMITQVDWGTAAAKAGLALEDIVVGFNGMRVRNARDLSNKVGLTRAGATVQLAVLRRGQPLDVSVTVAEAQ